MTTLFDSLMLGAIEAPNRVIMAPMTRSRADREGVPRPIMTDYYVQRASAGLIISEAIGISREGLGWPYAPGIWTDEQGDAWSRVVSAIHAAGGRVVAQLWHMGRQTHSSVTGSQPVSSSATRTEGLFHTYEGKQPAEMARELGGEEIRTVLNDFARAARNAKSAGFDGVQIHAANGYLIDQFLRDNANFRNDAYGGSIENRLRLLRETTERVAIAVGEDRTSIRLSPNGDTQGIDDSDPASVFLPAAAMLSEMGIGFLELREPGPRGTNGRTDVLRLSPRIREIFSGALVLNSDYRDLASAQLQLDEGIADAISFGRRFISNPDLPERLRAGRPLAEDDIGTWYTQDAAGYTDYPPSAGC